MACKNNYRWCPGWAQWEKNQVRPCAECIHDLRSEYLRCLRFMEQSNKRLLELIESAGETR